VFDREGNVLKKLGEPYLYNQPVFSPDGNRLAVVKIDQAARTQDIWVFDIATGASTPITPGPEPEASPVWSPDGKQIAYFSFRENYGRLYPKASDGTGSEELLYQHTLGAGMTLTDWSADGRFLAFFSGGVLYALSMSGANASAIARSHQEITGERKALELAREEFTMDGPRFSPDSRFLAYRSNETGQFEIFVRSFEPSSGFPLNGGKRPISRQGGLGLAYWRRDGKELYYLAADGGIMAVDVSTSPEFQAGTSKRLFRVPATIPLSGNPGAMGSIARDGQRIVLAVPVPPERKEVTVAPEILSKYTGTYVTPGGMEVAVTLEGNQLTVEPGPSGPQKVPLFAESETSFFFKFTNGDIEFVRDDKGNVTHLVGYFGGAGQKAARK
jgi:hypothetical protein